MLFEPEHIRIDDITDAQCLEQAITLEVLRLDLIHPIVSGNKLFKLSKFIDAAVQEDAGGLLTFGGAYSNHLVATAFLCRSYGMRSVGIVRGEEPDPLSPTLSQCIGYDMELRFISREAFAKSHDSRVTHYQKEYPQLHIVPEGGYHPMGVAGALSIAALIPEPVTHIACATGTCTMLAGLYLGRKPHQQLVAVPVLKGVHDSFSRLEYLTGQKPDERFLQVVEDYHFGGYAKHDNKLIWFMNALYTQYRIPTDKVYTAKLLYAVKDLIARNYFPKGSRILAVHSGGLQGNASLEAGTLRY